jgi:hypothetical protein
VSYCCCSAHLAAAKINTNSIQFNSFFIDNRENAVVGATHLAPQASHELGVLFHRDGDVDSAKKWFKRALTCYSGYSTELLVTYRAKMFLEDIKDKANNKVKKTADDLFDKLVFSDKNIMTNRKSNHSYNNNNNNNI